MFRFEPWPCWRLLTPLGFLGSVSRTWGSSACGASCCLSLPCLAPFPVGRPNPRPRLPLAQAAFSSSLTSLPWPKMRAVPRVFFPVFPACVVLGDCPCAHRRTCFCYPGPGPGPGLLPVTWTVPHPRLCHSPGPTTSNFDHFDLRRALKPREGFRKFRLFLSLRMFGLWFWVSSAWLWCVQEYCVPLRCFAGYPRPLPIYRW